MFFILLDVVVIDALDSSPDAKQLCWLTIQPSQILNFCVMKLLVAVVEPAEMSTNIFTISSF